MSYIGNSPTFLLKGSKAVFEYTATAGQTVFTGGDDNSAILKALDDTIGVYSNGVRLVLTDDYTLNTAGDTVTLTSAAALNDIIVIETFDEIANLGTYTKAEADARYINTSGDITTGTIQVSGTGNNIELGDNNKVTFGGTDLEIYSDGTTGQLAGNVNVTGTVTSDELIVSDNTGATLNVNTALSAADSKILLHEGSTLSPANGASIRYAGATNEFSIGVGSSVDTKRLSIARDTGDIRFYNAAGSAAKLYWDASDEKLAIGTTTPSSASNVLLTIGNTSLTYAGLSLMAGTNAEEWRLYSTFDGSNNAQFGVFRPASNDYKFIINESGNVGVGTSAPSTKLEVAGTTKAEQYLLDAVAKDISDTAVDVFIYDTRKDSDGGAWRKRTQHTSWYNETLNTATRGSRKEFPAVAVIVLESGGSTEGTSVDFTIYDGDDPDMPMWMQYRFVIGSGYNTGISALNGIITFGATDNGVLISDFVKDRMRLHNHVHRHTYGSIAPGRLGRSTVADVLEASVTGYSIVNQTVNDVAMTVLPNAPIDSATGLPVPTIAVATDGGVSVIKDDGTVVDITHTVSTNNSAGKIDIIRNRLVYSTQQSGSSTNYWRLKFIDIPSSDTTASYASNLAGYQLDARGTTGFAPALNTDTDLNDTHNNIIDFAVDKAVGFTNKLTLLQDIASISGVAVSSVYEDAAVAYVTSDYNTGWMNGDIKLATLSDTDGTNLGTELVTNGTFTSNVSGWTTNPSVASWSSVSGQAVLVQDANSTSYWAWQEVTVVPGNTYRVSIDVISTTNTSYFRVGSGGEGSSTYLTVNSIGTGTTTRTFTVPAGVTSVYINVGVTISGTIVFDNVSLKEDVADRSVNGNGLQVFGTVTKTAVATGADLVSYSGFSSSNYLEQPANTDLDFGTGDFSFTTWFKSTSAGGAQYFYKRGENTGGSAGMTIWTAADLQYIALYINGSGISTPSSSYSLGIWNQLVIARRNGDLTFYINGRVIHSAGLSGSVPTGMNTQVGYSATTSHLSLSRISATAPSPEQIKKMYEDEKFLFQENAKATLYGSSDAITALAYDDDTELLHVGTSAGRSVFQGLRRIDNTTDAVGAAISASNGMVAED